MKRWFEPLTTAWVGIITHKLRSFLTILGIVIGVAAVISLMSIGRGAQSDIMARIGNLGSDLVTISPGASRFGGVRGAAGSIRTLTQEDAGAIAEQIAYIDSVAPIYTSNLQLIVGSENTNSRVTGVPPQYQQIRNLDVAYGTFFSEYDYQRSARVVVLGSEVKETLFGETVDPIGQRIRMGANIVHVIGVLETKGAGYNSADNSILVPLTVLQQMVAQPRTSQGERVISSIALSVGNEDQMSAVLEEITSLLRTRHRLGPNVDDDFRITSMQEIAETITETTGTLTLLLGAIAAISLLVGGIGVMNIMLVSVLERTREIGVRKALGAKERDIWSQFLIEAALLTLTGGIIGIIIGWLISYSVNNSGMMTTVVGTDIVILAVSVSVGIGLFFGFYPAWNAARLNPIDALRSE
ncbi:MAG: multidrug ABC transporter substrate-binding protein [Dehalococcoidales bacterium]|nr:multidrug ABC transporter substrate-binding protein [Dehalococcoidales bacterium]